MTIFVCCVIPVRHSRIEDLLIPDDDPVRVSNSLLTTALRKEMGGCRCLWLKTPQTLPQYIRRSKKGLDRLPDEFVLECRSMMAGYSMAIIKTEISNGQRQFKSIKIQPCTDVASGTTGLFVQSVQIINPQSPILYAMSNIKMMDTSVAAQCHHLNTRNSCCFKHLAVVDSGDDLTFRILNHHKCAMPPKMREVNVKNRIREWFSA